MGEELCNFGKVLVEKCDLLVYSRKVGRQQIGSLSQEDRDEELALFFNIIPAQKLCKRFKETAIETMKTAKNDCENNKDDQDSSYLSKDFDRSRFNSSAEALGFPPIKPVDKRDAVSYA